MAEEQVESAFADKVEEVVETPEVVTETVKTETDWSAIPEDQLSAIIEKKTGVKLDTLSGLLKVAEEAKEGRRQARAENHELKEFKEKVEIDNASSKKEAELIYEKRLKELSAKQSDDIQDAKTAQDVAETRMKAFVLQAEGTKKLSGLVDSSLVDYIVEDIAKDFGVGDDNKLYRFEDIDGRRVLGKASFDDEFEGWFGKHRLNEFKLEGGIKGSGSRTGNSLKDDGPSAEDQVKTLFGLGLNKPQSVF